MAAPEWARGTHWYADPETGGLLQMVDGIVTETSGSLSELTGGEVSAGPGNFRDASTGHFVWGLMNDYPTFVDVGPGGNQVTWSRDVTVDEVNAEQFPRTRYGVFATGEIQFLGDTHSIDVQGWVTQHGGRLIVKSGTEIGSEGRYAYVADRRTGSIPAFPELPPGWEYADPLTALTRSTIGEIFKEYNDLMDDMIAKGTIGPDGQPLTKKYDVALMIAGQLEFRPMAGAGKALA